MEVDVYQREALMAMKNLMMYDLKRPAHKVIRERLIQAIDVGNTTEKKNQI